MFSLTVLLLVLLGGVSCNVIRTEQKSNDSDFDGFKIIFDSLFKDKCKKVGAVDPYTSFFQTLQTAVACVETHLNRHSNDSNSSEDICDYHNKNVHECFSDILINVKECLEPDEKYLPDFIFKSVNSLFELVCSDDTLEDALEKPSATKCIDDGLKNSKFLSACFDDISLQSFDVDNFVLKEEELCDHLQSFYGCYDSFLRKRCSYDREVRKILKKMYNAISSPCENDERRKK